MNEVGETSKREDEGTSPVVKTKGVRNETPVVTPNTKTTGPGQPSDEEEKDQETSHGCDGSTPPKGKDQPTRKRKDKSLHEVKIPRKKRK